MATKKPTLAATGGEKVKAVRKPKGPAMTMPQRFELMAYIKDGDAALPDVTLAKRASEKLGRKVAPQTVTEYRKQFGIESVKKPSSEQMQARVDELTAALAFERSEVTRLNDLLTEFGVAKAA